MNYEYLLESYFFTDWVNMLKYRKTYNKLKIRLLPKEKEGEETRCSDIIGKEIVARYIGENFVRNASPTNNLWLMRSYYDGSMLVRHSLLHFGFPSWKTRETVTALINKYYEPVTRIQMDRLTHTNSWQSKDITLYRRRYVNPVLTGKLAAEFQHTNFASHLAIKFGTARV